MELKLIKTDNFCKCQKCGNTNFTRVGQGWVCHNCNLYVFPELKIKKEK